MEFEVLDERIQWEAERVATAFMMNQWRGGGQPCLHGIDFSGSIEAFCVYWYMNSQSASLTFIDIGFRNVNGPGCRVWRASNQWRFHPNPQFSEPMARGLYRLGFEDEDVLSQLPPLTAHKKMELRLSLPREFWPQKWREEETK